MDEWVPLVGEEIAKTVHAVCLDRNLDPRSTSDTEAHCRVDRFLPQCILIARMAGCDEPEKFEDVCQRTICLECGERNAAGRCRVRDAAACCLYRYLPLIHEAINRVRRRFR